MPNITQVLMSPSMTGDLVAFCKHSLDIVVVLIGRITNASLSSTSTIDEESYLDFHQLEVVEQLFGVL
jgi:hypothetical protein